MSFMYTDEKGKQIRNRVVLKCDQDENRTEQSHKKEVDINTIVKRHGMDMIAKTALLQTPEYSMDEIPTNDFHEAMIIIAKAQQTFEQMPSEIRKEFHNNPAEYMDYIHNPDNKDALIERGWAKGPEEITPVEVIVTNSETPEPSEPVS